MSTAVLVAVLLGAVVGSVLNVLAWRIPRSTPAPADEAGVAAPGPAWRDVAMLGMRGARSRRAAPTPVLEVATALLFVLVVAQFGVSWLVPAYWYLVAIAVLLTVIDLQHHRLPNSVVLPSIGVALLSLGTPALAFGQSDALLRAVLGAAIAFCIYLVLAVIAGSAFGMGDVKLSAVLGLYLGYLSWRALFLGTALAFVLVAVVSALLLLTQRARRGALIPFGPAMLVAATGVALSPLA